MHAAGKHVKLLRTPVGELFGEEHKAVLFIRQLARQECVHNDGTHARTHVGAGVFGVMCNTNAFVFAFMCACIYAV